MNLETFRNTVQEMKALIQEGELSIAEERGKFKTAQGRATSLDDEGVIEAIALTDDDDDELFVQNILFIEKNGRPTVTGVLPD